MSQSELAEGQSVNIICAAESTSVPADIRYPLQYTWSVDQEMINRSSIDKGKYIIIPDVGREQLTILRVSALDVQITCLVNEEGADLYESASIILVVEGNFFISDIIIT